jgi:small subunit ribosomal protein S11
MGKKGMVIIGSKGRVCIKSSYNNTIVCLTNEHGDVCNWTSGGRLGLKGASRRAPYAAQMVAQECMKLAVSRGVKSVDVFVKGTGMGKDLAIKAISDSGLEILSITDRTGIPHNGCRPAKTRHL